MPGPPTQSAPAFVCGIPEMKMVRLTVLSLAAWSVFCRPMAAGAPDKMSIVSDGETVGYLVAAHSGPSLDIDYHVDENGRGPKHREHLRLGADGLPLEWTIDGTTLMGGPVHERMTWHAGRQQWTSQADKGDVSAPKPFLYIANDASPWAIGVYAAALLRTQKGELDVLPKGRLNIEKSRSVSLNGKV